MDWISVCEREEAVIYTLGLAYLLHVLVRRCLIGKFLLSEADT